MGSRTRAAGDKWVRTVCTGCYGNCAVRVHVVDGVAIKVEGDPDSVMGSQGGVCAKSSSMIQLLYHPKRFNYPLKRTNPEKLEQFSHMECDEINDELRGLASKTGIPWALVHFVLKEGRPCIYDVDVDPILNWLPAIYRKYLTEKLAHRLAGIKDKTTFAEKENLPNERPTIFLRRMLQILFEFERSKYGPRGKQ